MVVVARTRVLAVSALSIPAKNVAWPLCDATIPGPIEGNTDLDCQIARRPALVASPHQPSATDALGEASDRLTCC